MEGGFEAINKTPRAVKALVWFSIIDETD